MGKNSLHQTLFLKARHLDCMLGPSHWLDEISLPKRVCHHFWPELIPIAKNTLPIVPFDHFHWSFKILWNLPNPITHLTIHFLKITIKKIQTTKSNNFISHNIFSSHLYTSLFNTLYIIVCTIVLSYHLLPFWHLLTRFFFFFYLAIKKTIPQIPTVEMGKKMPSNFALLRHAIKLYHRQSIIMSNKFSELWHCQNLILRKKIKWRLLKMI
jgi:hypothetical protein